MATQIRKDLTHLCRELKAPSLLASFERLAKRGRDKTWSYVEFLAVCLEREGASRQSHGGENRIKAAHFPQTKTLEDFDFSYQRSVRKEVVAHLGTLDFIEAKDNVIFLVRREREESHLAIALGLRACQEAHRSRSRPRRPGSIA